MDLTEIIHRMAQQISELERIQGIHEKTIDHLNQKLERHIAEGKK